MTPVSVICFKCKVTRNGKYNDCHFYFFRSLYLFKNQSQLIYEPVSPWSPVIPVEAGEFQGFRQLGQHKETLSQNQAKTFRCYNSEPTSQGMGKITASSKIRNKNGMPTVNSFFQLFSLIKHSTKILAKSVKLRKLKEYKKKMWKSNYQDL